MERICGIDSAGEPWFIGEEIIRCCDCKEYHEPSGMCDQWSTCEEAVYTDSIGYCYMARKKEEQ